MKRIARIVTEIALGRLFDYLVPDHLGAVVRIGHRVRVPFGRREVFGYVVELTEQSDVSNLKTVHHLIGNEPLIPEKLIELARWMAHYYVCPFEVALRSVLPVAVRKPGAKFQTRLVVQLLKEPEPASFAQLRKKTPRQCDVIDFLRQNGPTALQQLSKRLGISPVTIRALERRGWVEISGVRQERDPFSEHVFLPTQPLNFNPEQTQAFDVILSQLGSVQKKVLLLHGVTGSGKTELYLQAIARCLDQGLGAIVLVPEISLTPQSVERFKSRFLQRGIQVAVLHSHLSEGERHDEWHRIREGRAKVVVGARSAVFAPIASLGIIVVDEEHESSYKQQEMPHYHARDVAVMRAKLEGAAVLLGSATPSLESYYHAKHGKYLLLQLRQRVDFQQMPKVRVVDMRYEAIRAKGPVVLSRPLYEAILQRIERKEQTILFLNRRGYSSALVCRQCGHVVMCPHCSVSQTYHQSFNRLLCHLCGHSETVPKICPKCEDAGIRYTGLGTERVEQAMERLFSQAIVRRMDSDTMTRKSAYEEILGEFRKGRIDVLVGTQMLAKGLHFPNVTLVGIVNADQALHLPDFRASERVFQLLTQVAGRAGRGDRVGEVIIQSFTPFHPSIQFARQHDFEGFFEQELEFRQAFGYPPFNRIMVVTIRSKNEDRCVFVAEQLERMLGKQTFNGIEIHKPVPAPISKLQGYFRYQIFIKVSHPQQKNEEFKKIFLNNTWPEGVFVSLDIDPVNLM